MVHVFDSHIQKANKWVKDLSDILGQDENYSYEALKSVLHCLRDRLPENEAVHLGAELPLLIRGMFFEAFKPGRTPIKYKKDEFFAKIMDNLQDDSIIPEELVSNVFKFLRTKISEGEINDIMSNLPKDMQELWQ